jgi:aminodeoxyfutalosine synthase
MSVTDAELTTLASTHDIIQLGMAADDVRRQRHGLRTTFVRVADVAIDGDAAPVWPPAAGEVRICGTPPSRAAAVARVRQVALLAAGKPVSAFSLAGLEQLAAGEAVTLRALLEDLAAAGLELVAEAPFDLLEDPRRAIEEVNISGLSLARLTIHKLPSADVVALYKAVAELQRAVGFLRAFAPLPRAVNPAVPSTGYDDVRRVALARIVVDNIPSIQVDWSRYGPKLAQVALTVGADDVDAVSPEDETTEGRRRAPLEEIRRNIRAAGQEPVERTGRFDPLRPVEVVPRSVEGRQARGEQEQ